MGIDLAKQIKDSLRLRDVMEFYGVQFNSRGFAKCPFHVEKTASLSIKNERYRCFGCGASGDVIDFVMRQQNLKYTQALVRLDTDFQLGLAGRKPTYRERRQASENRRIAGAKRQWEQSIHDQYLTLCEVHRLLFRRFVAGEEWLEETIDDLSEILDDFTGEEARNWKMRMTT